MAREEDDDETVTDRDNALDQGKKVEWRLLK